MDLEIGMRIITLKDKEIFGYENRVVVKKSNTGYIYDVIDEENVLIEFVEEDDLYHAIISYKASDIKVLE